MPYAANWVANLIDNASMFLPAKEGSRGAGFGSRFGRLEQDIGSTQYFG
jgi:hypothetical protein